MAVTASIRDSSGNAVRAALTNGKRDVRGMLFALMLLLCLLGSLLVLTVLMWDVIAQAIPVFDHRSNGFLTNDLNSNPDKAGVTLDSPETQEELVRLLHEEAKAI